MKKNPKKLVLLVCIASICYIKVSLKQESGLLFKI